MINKEMRVRFAPSPTGPFHIGGARSALFNWLLAKKHNGKFILRFEDTDRQRSTKESEENIKQSLSWLGINWDEGGDEGGPFGPYRQTERLDIYKEYTEKLLANGQAFYCYCTEEELQENRKKQMDKGETPIYQGGCQNLTEEEKKKMAAQGRKPTVRFKVPLNRQITFKDLVRGVVSFDSNGVGDFVIVKSDGIPVYNYAVVLDDALMNITHVIRAEEHLSNTPRQLLLYEALGFSLPEFGHISLILGKDKTKMSKRHGATSVEQYRKLGYLPEAILNFLALLGWSPPGEEEIFSCEQLIEEFSLDRVAKNPAVFDIDKLNWINAHYLKKSNPELIAQLALPHLIEAGIVKPCTAEDDDFLVKVIAEVQDYLSYAAQAVEHAGIFFSDDIELEKDENGETTETRQILTDADTPKVIGLFKEKLASLEPLEPIGVKAILKEVTKELKLNGKKVFMPLRIAITGKTHGPELINIIPLIGKERTLSRIDSVMALAKKEEKEELDGMNINEHI